MAHDIEEMTMPGTEINIIEIMIMNMTDIKENSAVKDGSITLYDFYQHCVCVCMNACLCMYIFLSA